MNDWRVISRFRKSGLTIYEVSNGDMVEVIHGKRALLKFLEDKAYEYSKTTAQRS